MLYLTKNEKSQVNLGNKPLLLKLPEKYRDLKSSVFFIFLSWEGFNC